MNKKIATGPGLLIVFIIAAAAIFFIWQASQFDGTIMQARINNHQKVVPGIQPAQEVGKNKEKGCTGSGGTVSSALCCGQVQDFPNTCAIGACGCAPASSHQVKTCDCGDGKCFNGNACVGMNGKPELE